MESVKKYYLLHKKEIMIFLTILVVMMSVTAFSSNVSMVHSSSDIETEINTTLGESIENYAGVFSVAVTASVNPTATLAVLSLLGIVENADVYFPEVVWINNVGDFLNKVPLIKTAGNLPIANPVALVLFAIIAVVLCVLRSTSASKAVSEATVDQIERYGGYIVTVALSLIPVATSQVVAAERTVSYVSAGTYAVTLIIGLLATVFNSIVYICVNKCIDAVEVIAAAVPIKGMNAIVQILKALLHLILVVLQIFSPVLSVIFSIIIAIVALCLFRKLTILSTYYEYIYIKPLWNRIFHKNEQIPFLHKRFPKRGRKIYPELQMAIPAFSMNKHEKLLKKRELVWLVPGSDGPKLLKIKAFRKIKEIPLNSLHIMQEPLYLQKTIRFTRVMTEDKKVEIIISNEYSDYWEQLLQSLMLTDYQVVKDRKKAEKEEKKQERAEKRQQKMEEIGDSLNQKKKKLVGIFKPKPAEIEEKE